jgi:RimJ/RimL family protein N-acetyltransferase
MWTDPSVTRHISGRPSTQEETWGRILRYAGHWAYLNFGYWAIEERTSGDFIGEVGFADHHRNMEPSLTDMPEIGWVIITQARGKGYATEAVMAALAWGDASFGARRTSCVIAPENTASIRVAEKCGYQPWMETQYHGQPALLFVRPAMCDANRESRRPR